MERKEINKKEIELHKIRQLESKLFFVYTYIYNDFLYNLFMLKLINGLLKKGKKHTAELLLKKQLYRFQLLVKEENLTDYSINIFVQALKNIIPLVDFKKHEMSQKKYFVPNIILLERKRVIKGVKSMVTVKSISKEIINSFLKKGEVYSKKLEANELAYRNRAFTHYRWTH